MKAIVKKVMLASLLATSSVAQSNELDNLLQASAAIVDQINTGILSLEQRKVMLTLVLEYQTEHLQGQRTFLLRK